MERSRNICIFLLVFFVLSACEDWFYDPDTAQRIDAFPTTFPGLEHDIVYIENEKLVRLNKDTHEIKILDLPNIKYIPRYLTISSNGKYLYFLVRETEWGSVGLIYQYDLEANELTQLQIEPVHRFSLINDYFIYTSIISEPCIENQLFRLDTLNRIEDGKRMLFCEAYYNYAIANDTPTSGFTSSISYHNGLYFSYLTTIETIDNTNVRREYKVSFTVSGDQLIVVDFEEIAERPDGIVSQDGRYFLKIIKNEGLWIEDLSSGELTLIDESIRVLSNVQFVIDDTHVMIRKERAYSSEFARRYGYHLFDISTGQYFQLLEQSQDMRMARVSESGNQIVAASQFRNSHNWHIAVLSYDQQTIALVSNPDRDSTSPFFVY